MAGGDPLKHVATGQPLEIPAAAYNLWCDDARLGKRVRLGQNGGGVPNDLIVSQLSVKVINQTDSDLTSFSVVKLVSPLGAPDSIADDPHLFLRRPILTGEKPSSNCDIIGITEEPIEKGTTSSPGVGAAIITGCAIVDVDITDTSHCAARPIPDDTAKLESATSGPARILWRPDESTGVKRCVVMLSTGCGCGCSEDCTNCSGCSYAIAIFNSNGIVDDDFKLNLNGETIQDNILETTLTDPPISCRGRFLHPPGYAHLAPNPTPNDGCTGNIVWTKYEVAALADLSATPSPFDFDLISISNNGFDNFGQFIVYRICNDRLCEHFRGNYSHPSPSFGSAAEYILTFYDPGNPLIEIEVDDGFGNVVTLNAGMDAAAIDAALEGGGWDNVTVTVLGFGQFNVSYDDAGPGSAFQVSGGENGSFTEVDPGSYPSDPELSTSSFEVENPCSDEEEE